MKKIILLHIFLVGISISLSAQTSTRLYPIVENNLYGFINETGKVVIQPQFYSIGNFSEGLAPARKGGSYGYIDETGKYIIADKYDYAEPFDHGVAKVYVNGVPSLIDKAGSLLFKSDFKSIESFGSHSYTVATTYSGKQALINKNGKFITDTIFDYIHHFENNRAIVESINDPLPDEMREEGLIDTTGKWIIKFGTYFYFVSLNEGFYKVTYKFCPYCGFLTSNQRVINKNGEVKYNLPSKGWNFLFYKSTYQHGLMVVDIDSPFYYSKKSHYKGVVDTNGNLVLKSKAWEELEPISKTLRKAKSGNKWFLLDNRWAKKTQTSFVDIFTNESIQGYTDYNILYAEDSSGFFAIDTNGVEIAQPTVKCKNCYFNYIVDSLIFFIIEGDQEKGDYSTKFCFWNMASNMLMPVFYDYIEEMHHNEKLIWVSKDSIGQYLDRNGNVIWQERRNISIGRPLNIDYVNSNCCGLDIRHDATSDSASDIYPRRLYKNTANYKEDAFKVFIDTTVHGLWINKYFANAVFILNSSKDTIVFQAISNQLELIMQAKDENGAWRNIEKISYSHYWETYFEARLNPMEYYKYDMPVYKGGMKTKLRAKLTYRYSNSKKFENLYSNEIDGSINPGQFWRSGLYSNTRNVELKHYWDR